MIKLCSPSKNSNLISNIDFPIQQNKFFDTYEVNLTELIAQYQQHASDAEKRAETTETKLANLRKLVMQLLKPSLNFVSYIVSSKLFDDIE